MTGRPGSARAAAPGDADRLAALERALFGPDAWSAEQVRALLADRGRRVLVAGEPVEGYVVTAVVGDTADLERIAIDVPARRRGLARHLLDLAAARAAADGADRMLLEVAADNAAALALYDAAGFTELGRRQRYYRSGADAVVMARPLVGTMAP